MAQGARLTVDDHEVLAMFARLQAVGMSGQATAPLSEVMYTAVMDNFEAEGRPDKWDALAASTLARTGEHAVLQQTGAHLRGRVTRSFTSRVAEVGVKWVAAAIHQFGGMAGRGRKVKIPARPYLVLTDDDNRELVGTMMDLLDGATR